MTEPVITSCNHYYCWSCLWQNVVASGDYKCPNCIQFIFRVRKVSDTEESPVYDDGTSPYPSADLFPFSALLNQSPVTESNGRSHASARQSDRIIGF